jgi:hypothetical protein
LISQPPSSATTKANVALFVVNSVGPGEDPTGKPWLLRGVWLGDVRLSGPCGDDQPGGDGPVGHALGDHPEDLSFSFADLGNRAVDDYLEGTVNVSSWLALC